MIRNHMMKLDTYRRVLGFGETAEAELANDPCARDLLDRLSMIVEKMWGCESQRSAGNTDARKAQAGRDAARTALRESLRVIQRTAQGMSRSVPGIVDIFTMPPRFNDQNLVETARAFLEQATPLAAEFTRRSMPADFLEQLRARIAAFEKSGATKLKARSGHVVANAEIQDLVREGDGLVAELDAIMRNRFAEDKGMLLTWDMSVRMGRAGRGRGASPGEQDGAPAPPQS